MSAVVMPKPEARSEKKLAKAHPNMAGQPNVIPSTGFNAAENLTADTSNAGRYRLDKNVVMKNVANDAKKMIRFFYSGIFS